ncbi:MULTISPECIES: hypothetical protein [unclassified Arthrobacter]|uniref:hypothetical protein n=1 Tax=unclassified Arthrobacter TaxID=235627 RepID=UPI001CFF6DC2|nr:MULTISPECIES: hypothetical protein [unclassified Arthrobacter]MCB5282714.1 hypothetical protein [Arthrobacter sp. ES1]WGZ79099.1 hypothetical protein QI450_14750 [Arthrobacter sp. EM1]
MTAGGARQVHSCAELSVGDRIEAWHNGKLFHRGEVIRTVAAMDLFWILDERTGARKLIDTEALLVLRAEAANIPAAAQLPARPPSHIPLFLAPGCSAGAGNGSGLAG